jgi:hypothetical protein
MLEDYDVIKGTRYVRCVHAYCCIWYHTVEILIHAKEHTVPYYVEAFVSL